jgi:hypothetical protein
VTKLERTDRTVDLEADATAKTTAANHVNDSA